MFYLIIANVTLIKSAPKLRNNPNFLKELFWFDFTDEYILKIFNILSRSQNYYYLESYSYSV